MKPFRGCCSAQVDDHHLFAPCRHHPWSLVPCIRTQGYGIYHLSTMGGKQHEMFQVVVRVSSLNDQVLHEDILSVGSFVLSFVGDQGDRRRRTRCHSTCTWSADSRAMTPYFVLSPRELFASSALHARTALGVWTPRCLQQCFHVYISRVVVAHGDAPPRAASHQRSFEGGWKGRRLQWVCDDNRNDEVSLGRPRCVASNPTTCCSRCLL